MNSNYLIVGSGLTGAVIARVLTDAGRSVQVVERRSHIGGNVHDHVHPSGIRVHTYGPHYFRTNDDELWEFVNRFSRFYTYEAILKSYVDQKYENWPIAAGYIRRVVGNDWSPTFKASPRNFEEAALSMMPLVIYEKFVKGYTEKQWGVSPTELSQSLAKRFDVREDDDPRLMRHIYQGLPVHGYAEFVRGLLLGIPVILNCDYLKYRETLSRGMFVIFTGPIDEFFGYDLGKLKYRGQRRDHEYLADVEFALPCGQVNNPDLLNGSHIRTLEWKHMMPSEYLRGIRGTVLTHETPFTPQDPNDYEYPFPDEANKRLYEIYRKRADGTPNLLICGRLGEYRYYDMDQAIARARVLAKRLLTKENTISSQSQSVYTAV
jgi:UDP-galactopyranose mutase